MRLLAFRLLIAVNALFMLSSCCKPSGGQGLTQREVITLAKAKAKLSGYDTAEYAIDARYNFVEADDIWVVFFEKKPTPEGMTTTGSTFTISVGNRSREVWLVPGR